MATLDIKTMARVLLTRRKYSLSRVKQPNVEENQALKDQMLTCKHQHDLSSTM